MTFLEELLNLYEARGRGLDDASTRIDKLREELHELRHRVAELTKLAETFGALGPVGDALSDVVGSFRKTVFGAHDALVAPYEVVPRSAADGGDVADDVLPPPNETEVKS